MLFRNLLLAVGLLCLVAGLVLSVVWLDQIRRSTVAEKAPEIIKPAILVTVHSIPAGTLLRRSDFVWREVGAGDIGAGTIMRGRASENEYIGAVTRRDFASNEPLIASDLVKSTDRQFLAAVLKPGTRAVSIAVDASQSASGLALPGDYVDVILTQSFSENAGDPGRRSVGETVLHNIRVIAVDQMLGPESKSGSTERGVFAATSGATSRIPKTVTLELNERQAEILMVGVQLGKINLSVRSLERPGPGQIDRRRALAVTWASDVSPALTQLARKQPGSGSTVESAVRWAPVTPQ
jgi:pilus assembly protein CpaB